MAHVCVAADQGFERVDRRVHAELSLQARLLTHVTTQQKLLMMLKHITGTCRLGRTIALDISNALLLVVRA